MGRDLASNFSIARQTFEEADETLGFKLSTLCFDGPEEDLKLTFNTQPAISNGKYCSPASGSAGDRLKG
jgi:[acyl-carrier-protein] S-malonyltransferase